MTLVARTRARARVRPSRLLVAILVGLILAIGALAIGRALEPRRTTPVYDPPVLAGQQIPGYCSGGVYARHGDTIVLTTSPHCAGEGTIAYDPGRTTVQGVFGPTARDGTCPYPGHTCAASDMNYLVVAADRIPWGHLNVVDLGTAGYRIIPPGTRPLACADIAIGDPAEIDGRDVYRSGTVAEKGENLYPQAQDGSYFPCMIAANIEIGGGDSGGVVLVRGIPAGVTSRSFGGRLGFTPLAEGLAELGLDLCTAPDCGLVPPPSVMPTTATSSGTPSLTYVAFGDSWPYGAHCNGCRLFPVLYAEGLAVVTGRQIDFANLVTDGGTAKGLLADFKSSRAIRDDLARADIVMIATGGNDLAPAFDAYVAGTCGGTDKLDCFRTVAEDLRAWFDGMLTEIEALRNGQPTVIRLVTTSNEFLGDRDLMGALGADFGKTTGVAVTNMNRDVQCQVGAAHHAKCVDLGLALNRPDLLKPQDVNTQEAMQKVADAILASGLDEHP